MKKILALLLALCMALSLCPALAEETQEAPKTVEAPAAMTEEEEIVLAAYALEDGASLPDKAVLNGLVMEVATPYSEESKNITVSIAVGNLLDKPVQCRGLTGEGVETLEAGKFITVSGILRNEQGIIGFEEGCTLDHIMTDEQLIAMAFGSAEGLEGLKGLGDLFSGLLGGAEGAESLEGLGALLGGAEGTDDLSGLLGGLLGGSNSGEEQSAESAVLGFLNGLGVDTTGMEEEITSAVGEVKSKLSDLGESAKGLFGTIKEKAGEKLNKLGEGLEAFLGELNESAEQTKSTTGSEIEEMKAELEKLLKEAMEKDPESEETKALTELVEAAKNLTEDDEEAMKAFFTKVVEILFASGK